MGVPVLVTAPTATLVSLSEMKAHCRVDFDDDDALITGLLAAAVAYLDGWRGVLGRAIMPQTWSQEFHGEGPHVLAMPDASDIVVTQDGDEIADPVISISGQGPTVLVSGTSGTITVTYDCAMAAGQLPIAQMIVKLIVANWYENREAATEGTMANLPLAVASLIDAIRWRHQ